MKKHYTSLIGLTICTLVVVCQNKTLFTNVQYEQAVLSVTPIQPDSGQNSKNPTINYKAFKDVLFSEDFSSGTATSLPIGWKVVNNDSTINNFQWDWDTIYQDGQFSNATDIITSASASNGFMSLTGDFFNTPIPITGAVEMNTYIESPTITIANPKPSYWVKYDQAVRYCCNAGNRLVLQASVDNFATFVEYDATNGIAVNALWDSVNYINISSAVGGASSFKVRFLAQGNSHYFWMIDDFAIIEGAANDLQMDSPYLEFNSSYGINPFYYEIPFSIFPPLPFSASIRNNGSNTATGVNLRADVFHESYGNGAPGVGLVYSAASPSVTMVSSATLNDTSIFTLTPDSGSTHPNFIPTVSGSFQVNLAAVMDSVDQWDTVIGIDTYTQPFILGDTSLRRVDETLGGGTGTGSYVRNGQIGGQVPGDAFGTLVIVESPASVTDIMKTPTSLTYVVSANPSQIGVEISPTIWEFDENAATLAAAFGNIVASSFVPYTITAASIGNSITLPLDNGSAVFNGLPDGQYVIGWTVVNPNGGNNFEVQTDNSTGQFQTVSSFVDLAHNPGWGFVDENPAIILNMGMLPLSTGTRDLSTPNAALSIVPNPSNGEFQLNIKSLNAVNYQLNVRNVLGQTVYQNILTVQGTMTELIDLSSYEKGVYFVSLENEQERILRKVIIQ